MTGARGAGAGHAAGRRWAHGARATCAHGLGQLGARAPGLVFNLVFQLGIFPESLNEHCSSQIFFFFLFGKKNILN